MDYGGYKQQKGEQVIAITDNYGSLPKGLHALKQVATQGNLDLRGIYCNLDGGFDARGNWKMIFNAGMIPNNKENSRNRKTTKRGRKRLFNNAIYALRMRVKRTLT
jgi:hypothetical protein